MRAHEFITEAVTDNVVYHATTLQGLKGMIQSGAIQPSSAETAHGWGGGGGGDHGSVSLTRDRNYFPFDFTDVQITLNRDALAQNFRIQPYNFAGRSESEERVDRPIPLTSRYVRSIGYRNRPPSRPMQAALKKLGIPVEPYRELPGVNRQYVYKFDPAAYGNQKRDWNITDMGGDVVWKRLSGMTATQAQAALDDYEYRMKPTAHKNNPDYPNRYRLVPVGEAVTEDNSMDFDKIPVEPIEEMQEEWLQQMLLSQPALFENTSDYREFKDFLELHRPALPEPRESYIYTSIHTLLPAHHISVAHFDQPHTLVEIRDGRAYFDVGGQIKPYPEVQGEFENLLKSTWFFPSVSDFKKFQLLLKLKFSNWHTQYRTIHVANVTSVDENFKDGRGPGRPGDSQRHGIPKKASMSQLEKASHAKGRKGQLARWQINMRRGKAKKS